MDDARERHDSRGDEAGAGARRTGHMERGMAGEGWGTRAAGAKRWPGADGDRAGGQWQMRGASRLWHDAGDLVLPRGKRSGGADAGCDRNQKISSTLALVAEPNVRIAAGDRG